MFCMDEFVLPLAPIFDALALAGTAKGNSCTGISSQTVMATDSGKVKLMDFGLAKLEKEHQSELI